MTTNDPNPTVIHKDTILPEPIRPLTDAIHEHVGRALAMHALGEDVMWDYSISLDPQAGAMATLSIWLKGIIIGSHFNFTFQVNPVMISTPEGAQQVIGEAMATAKEAKSQQMLDMQRQAMEQGGPLNGSPPVA